MLMQAHDIHDVIPALAGIQTGFSDIRVLRLDSRLRGNDDGGWGRRRVPTEACSRLPPPCGEGSRVGANVHPGGWGPPPPAPPRKGEGAPTSAIAT